VCAASPDALLKSPSVNKRPRKGERGKGRRESGFPLQYLREGGKEKKRVEFLSLDSSRSF